MAQQFASPGVNIAEVDLTRVPVTRTTTTAGFAGVFRWGPVNERTTIQSVAQLVSKFGSPKKSYNQETFYTVYDYLSYSDKIVIVRASTGATAAGPSSSDPFYNSPSPYLAAKYTGTMGSSLKVRIVSRASWDSIDADTKSMGSGKPGKGLTNGVIDNKYHVFVIDEDGLFTGTRGKLLEKFENVSDEETAKNSGASIFMVDVINNSSKYITFNIPSTSGGEATLKTQLGINPATNPSELINISISLTGAVDGTTESTVTTADLFTAYDLFASAEDVDLTLLIQGKARGTSGNNYAELGNKLIDIASNRKDCVAFISPDYADVVNNAGLEVASMVAFGNSLTGSSYAMVDSGYKYRYDKYNDVYIYTPLNGDIAGLCARTDSTNDPWFSPAGYNRGLVKNVVKLAFNPKQADRDTLYQSCINPVITQPGVGTILFGDKTHVLDDDTISAFDRVNVRRLFIAVERVISRASKNLLFEFNNEFTRSQFTSLVEPYLRDVQGRQGIYDFRVVCDETNNTSDVVDRNQFVGDIYIKPARSINYIQLNFVAVRSGVEFEEIVGTV